jgi:hypothetical protein
MKEKDLNRLVRTITSIKLMEMAEELNGIDDIARTATAAFAAILLNKDYVLIDFLEWALNKLHDITIEEGKDTLAEDGWKESLAELEELKGKL